MTDQPASTPDELEPEDLLPEEVEGIADPVTTPPATTDDIGVWQQRASQNIYEQPAHPPTDPEPPRH